MLDKAEAKLIAETMAEEKSASATSRKLGIALNSVLLKLKRYAIYNEAAARRHGKLRPSKPV